MHVCDAGQEFMVYEGPEGKRQTPKENVFAFDLYIPGAYCPLTHATSHRMQ